MQKFGAEAHRQGKVDPRRPVAFVALQTRIDGGQTESWLNGRASTALAQAKIGIQWQHTLRNFQRKATRICGKLSSQAWTITEHDTLRSDQLRDGR